jgi:hypothetical protein
MSPNDRQVLDQSISLGATKDQYVAWYLVFDVFSLLSFLFLLLSPLSPPRLLGPVE